MNTLESKNVVDKADIVDLKADNTSNKSRLDVNE